MPRPHAADDREAAVRPAATASALDATKQLDALVDAEERLASERRETMVTPAPPGFKPRTTGRKIELRVELESVEIRAGGFPRIRFALTNVSSAAIEYVEHRPSYFSRGATPFDSPTLHIRLTDEKGRTEELLPYSGRRRTSAPPDGRAFTRPPQGLSESEMADWARDSNARSQAHATFRVRLLPGETLRSQGDDGSPDDPYKTLYTDTELMKPGRYRLRIDLDDRPQPLTDLYMKALLRAGETRESIQKSHAERLNAALGPITSNVVVFEVVR